MSPPRWPISANETSALILSMAITYPLLTVAPAHAQPSHLPANVIHTVEPALLSKLRAKGSENVHDDSQLAARLLRGAQAYQENRLDDAITEFSAIIEANPKSFEALYNRGSTYYRKGLMMEAIADYTTAIDLAPTFPWIFISRGSAYSNLRRFDLALPDFDEAIRLDPSNGASYYNRGLLHSKEGHYA